MEVKSVWDKISLEDAVSLILEMDGAGIVVTDTDLLREELEKCGLKTEA